MIQQIIGCALCALMLAASCKQKETAIKPEVKQLTEAVYASGTLVPEQEYKVVASTDGFLQQALVKEGDTVKKGQLLFALSNDNQQAQIDAASAMLHKTQPVASTNSPAILDLRNRLAAAQTRLQNDEQQYKRYKNLVEQNAIAAATYDRFKLQYETTQKEVQSLEEQLRQQQLNANIQLQQASNQLLIARTSKSNGQLKSYVDGVVYDVYKQTGDMIAPNQPIALVGTGDMIAKLLVDEDDLEKVNVGQQVLISMDAYPDKVFKATIKKIYPLLNKVEQSFRVDALFDEPIPTKLYGLNVEANIVIKENSKALVIPKKALLKGDSVLIKQDGQEVKVKVKKGVEDDEYVQVTAGINEETTLIVGK